MLSNYFRYYCIGYFSDLGLILDITLRKCVVDSDHCSVGFPWKRHNARFETKDVVRENSIKDGENRKMMMRLMSVGFGAYWPWGLWRRQSFWGTGTIISFHFLYSLAFSKDQIPSWFCPPFSWIFPGQSEHLTLSTCGSRGTFTHGLPNWLGLGGGRWPETIAFRYGRAS